ncbi:tetratricopeptide repeat protein [Micromonospora sp. NPDC007271]|uniref:tetratricopeptide repeat protein n=1 Tax=Micromonospora sp. NPDC007271 TaxID=3154587 RepID=UPI00340C42B7
MVTMGASAQQAIQAAYALLATCRRPQVSRSPEIWAPRLAQAVELARSVGAQQHQQEPLTLLLRILATRRSMSGSPSEPDVTAPCLFTIIEVLGDQDVPSTLDAEVAAELTSTARHLGDGALTDVDPAYVAAMGLIAVKLSDVNNAPLVAQLVHIVRRWDQTRREAHWTGCVTLLTLHGQTLAASGRPDEAIPVLEEAVGVLRPRVRMWSEDPGDLLALAIRELAEAYRLVGRHSAAEDLLSGPGSEGLSEAMKAFGPTTPEELGNRADDLMARAEDVLRRGEAAQAADLAGDALRARYQSRDARRIQQGHYRYADFLVRHEPFAPAVLAHLVASCVLAGLLDEPVRISAVGAALKWQAGWHDIGTVKRLSERVDGLAGVRFGQIMAEIQLSQQVLNQVLRMAVQSERDALEEFAGYRVMWDPVLAAIMLARQGDAEMASRVREYLRRYEGTVNWRALAAGLALVLDDREDDAWNCGLDGIDEVLLGRCVNVVHRRIHIPSQLAVAMPIAGVFGLVFRAMKGSLERPEDLAPRLAQIEMSGQWEGLVPLLLRLVDGERDRRMAVSTPSHVRSVIDMLLDAAALS